MTVTTIRPNTQAILLLTAPLRMNGRETASEQLTAGEYSRLARLLHERDLEPADLIGPKASALVHECASVVEPPRLERLLGRGFQLAQAIERWHTRAIWVVSRADNGYPRRWKTRLRESAPPVLYGCGNAALLDAGGLAVVGSREADQALLDYSQAVGRLAAQAGRTVVSGGARGVDQAAMHGALEAGGRAVGVLADGLERAAVQRDHRQRLMDGKLLLVSPFDPAAGFHVGQAMQRNKLIYALADAALVVNADFEKGGSWTGAVEQLDRLRLVPVYVRARGDIGKGLEGLRARGARPWPEPQAPEQLVEALAAPMEAPQSRPRQHQLPFGGPGPGMVREPPPAEAEAAAPAGVIDKQPKHEDPAEVLFAKVRELIERMKGAKTETEIADELRVSKGQVKVWLKRLVDEGVLTRLKKPARYRAIALSGRAP